MDFMQLCSKTSPAPTHSVPDACEMQLVFYPVLSSLHKHLNSLQKLTNDFNTHLGIQGAKHTWPKKCSRAGIGWAGQSSRCLPLSGYKLDVLFHSFGPLYERCLTVLPRELEDWRHVSAEQCLDCGWSPLSWPFSSQFPLSFLPWKNLSEWKANVTWMKSQSCYNMAPLSGKCFTDSRVLTDSVLCWRKKLPQVPTQPSGFPFDIRQTKLVITIGHLRTVEDGFQLSGSCCTPIS